MTIRTLRDDEPIPNGEPRKYKNQSGYVRLRWLVGTDEYVECYEHRVVMGRPVGQVHHIDGVKDNNDPSNLVVLSTEEHTRLHQRQYKAEGRWKGRRQHREQKERIAERDRLWAEIAAEHAAGMSTTKLGAKYGKHHTNISRGLHFRGYPVNKRKGWDYGTPATV